MQLADRGSRDSIDTPAPNTACPFNVLTGAKHS